MQEYWQFDPKGEWIEEKLRGYRLQGETYQAITDKRSVPLQLRLEVEEKLIEFSREDTGDKLLIPDELVRALQQETQARIQAQEMAERERRRAEQAEERLEQERQRADRLAAQLRALGAEPEA